MFLHLKNFRSWTDKTVEITDIGLILLSGHSGAGKTNILKAIYFSLFGKGSKLIKYGERKCSVQLIWKEFNITRSKGPEKLSLIYNGEEYIDDVAQEIIFKKFGKNFEITSYIAQKSTVNFLKQTPAEKTKFLETLVLGEYNIDKIKDKINEKIQENKKNVNESSGRLKLAQEQFSELKKPEEVVFPLEGKYSEIKVKNEHTRYENTLKRIKKINETKINYEKKIIYQENIKGTKEIYDNIISERNIILEDLKNKKKSEELLDEEEIKEIKIYLKYLKDNREYVKISSKFNTDENNYNELKKEELSLLRNELLKLKNELKILQFADSDEINELESKIKYKVNLYKLFKELEDKENEIRVFIDSYNSLENFEILIQKLETEISSHSDLIKQITSSLNNKKCPSCNAQLKLINDVLVLSESECNLDIIDKKEEIKTLQKKVEEFKYNLNKTTSDYINYKNKIQEIESINNKLNLASKSDLSEEINNLRSILENKLSNNRLYVDKIKKISTLEKTINNEDFSSSLKKLKVQLLETKTILNKLFLEIKYIPESEFDMTEEELVHELDKHKRSFNKIKDINNQILDTKKIISENTIKRDSLIMDDIDYKILLSELVKDEEKLKIEHKTHKNNVEKLKKYLEYKKEKDIWKNFKSKITEYEEEEKLFLKKLTVSQSFKKKISEAESKAITQTIENMNIFVSQYLNIFFTDNPMTIEISPYKETKKDIKPVINISIIYKGNEIDLDNLSGGEFDRVVLCFMLALNYMWGNDLLLLDESLSSLDSDLTNEILELLKSHPHFQNKLVILVAHQISEGNFDQIINIE